MDNKCHIGDCREVLKSMAECGVRVQMCVTSPPYWGLRDYGVEGQIGLESTIEEYVATMVEVFRGVRNVLADDGTCWINLGDSFWNGGDEKRDNGHGFVGGGKPKLSAAKGSLLQRKSSTGLGLKRKDMCGIPWRIAFALQADGWYLRSDIIWAKPNPMPESVTDRPTKAHEYVFMLSKRGRYYYDQDAVREPASDSSNSRLGRDFRRDAETGRNCRTVWTIPSQSFADAHFATFPEKLVEPCILAGTSARGHCPGCGERWTRQIQLGEVVSRGGSPKGKLIAVGQYGEDIGNRARRSNKPMEQREHKTCGWGPTCQCNLDPIPDVVMDPFLGSGTTAQVAQRLGRWWLGVDLNPSYTPMQKKRVAQMAMVVG